MDGLVDDSKTFANLFVLGSMPAQDISISLNDVQNVVEIVRDAAGQDSDAFHLLRLQKLLF